MRIVNYSSLLFLILCLSTPSTIMAASVSGTVYYATKGNEVKRAVDSNVYFIKTNDLKAIERKLDRCGSIYCSSDGYSLACSINNGEKVQIMGEY